jgi:hypothetical protein
VELLKDEVATAAAPGTRCLALTTEKFLGSVTERDEVDSSSRIGDEVGFRLR